MLISIYCSGGIQKNPNDANKLCWTDKERDEVSKSLSPHEALFLNPDDPLLDLSDSMAVFGRDMYQIQFANFVITDARQRRGIGIGTEMVASKILGTPLIVVTPQNGHYRRDELYYRGSNVKQYIHPHLEAFADAIVESFSDAGNWIKEHFQEPKLLKGTDVITESIARYQEILLSRDRPMLEVIQAIKDANC